MNGEGSDYSGEEFGLLAARCLETHPDGELHSTTDFFSAVAGAGLLRRRWSASPEEGLRMAVSAAASLGAIDLGLGLAISIHSEVFIHTLQRYGRSPAAREVLAQALSGDLIGCVGLTEESGGSDLAAARSTAVRLEGGGWHLNAEKLFTSNAGIATHAIVTAQVATSKRRTPTLFLVDLSTSGVVRHASYATLGVETSSTAGLTIDAFVPDEAVIGPVGAGLACIAPALRHERICAAAAVLESASASLRHATAFLATRATAAGPLLSESAIRHRIARCEIEMLSARSLLEQTLVRMTRRSSLVEADVAATKYTCARVAQYVIDESMQFMGGRGYLRDYPIEKAWRDTRLVRIGGGTDEVMLNVVAKHALRHVRRSTEVNRSVPPCGAVEIGCTKGDGTNGR